MYRLLISDDLRQWGDAILDRTAQMMIACRCLIKENRDIGMPRDYQHNPDPNANAARILRETITDEDKFPADVEAAWQAWYSHIQAVDERGMTLLRAAFEAGWHARGKAGNSRGD